LTYLDLQEIIPTNTLVMHLMVGIICISAALIFNECKSTYVSTILELTPMLLEKYSQTTGSSSRSWDVAADKAAIAVDSLSALSLSEGKDCEREEIYRTEQGIDGKFSIRRIDLRARQNVKTGFVSLCDRSIE
jgi:hypothetical protein